LNLQDTKAMKKQFNRQVFSGVRLRLFVSVCFFSFFCVCECVGGLNPSLNGSNHFRNQTPISSELAFLFSTRGLASGSTQRSSAKQAPPSPR